MNQKQKITFLLMLCMFFYGHFNGLSQDGSNPFDLKDRLDQKTVPSDDTTISTILLAPPPSNGNPFEITRLNAPSNEKTVENTAIKPIIQPNTTPNKTAKGNFKFWVITFLLVTLTLLITLYNNYLVKSYRAFLNDNFLKMIQREAGTVAAIPYYIFYLLYFISMGVFLSLVLAHYDAPLPYSNFKNLMLLIGGVAGVFLIKHFVINALAFTFPLEKELSQYNFTIIIFNIIIGIALIPANIFIAFAPATLTGYLIYGTFIAIAGLYLFRALRGVFLASKFLLFHKFHFFMYLCTIEIAPLLVLSKIILLLTGLH